MNVLPWEASDRREMLIVGAVDADGHKAAAYFVELDADGKRSLGEWSSRRDRTMRAIPSPGLDTFL
jgi:hypothetical protein